MPTLIFFGLCAAAISSPFIWRWRHKRAVARTIAGLAASDNEVLMIEIEQHLAKRRGQ